MNIYSISDLHLSLNNPKPMDIFGPVWNNYVDIIFEDWKNKVKEDDIVLIAGDISWAMKLEDAIADLKLIGNLPGKKIIIRGNHDYWWKSISSIRSVLPHNFFALQNDSMQIDNYIFCGTRGWQVPEVNFKTEEDKKIYKRELLRLELSLQNAKTKQLSNSKNGNNSKIICLIHYPPFNSNCDDSDFTKLFKKYEVNTVVYGHLHGNKSRKILKKNIDGIDYYLTSCDIVGNKLVKIF